MLGFNKVVIADYERGLKFTNRRLIKVLEPGVYRWFELLKRETRIDVVDVSTGRLSIPRGDYLIRNSNERVSRYFDVVDIGPSEVGLIYRNGKLDGILKPTQSLVLWRDVTDLRVERVDMALALEVSKELANEVLRSSLSIDDKRAIYFREIGDHELGLLSVDGKFERMLSPGPYAFWALHKTVSVEVVDTRLQALEVSGQEMLTKDKVSLRINLAASYRIVEAVKARIEHKDIGHTYTVSCSLDCVKRSALVSWMLC